MTKLTKTIPVKSVAWDTIQQMPDGGTGSDGGARSDARTGFAYLPVLYVNGKLTTISGEKATTAPEANRTARYTAIKLAHKNGLVATKYEGDPQEAPPRKPAKTEGIYVLKDAKIPKKQVWKKVASVPVKTVKPSKATLIFTTPEFNFKGTIRRAIKLLTEDYKYMGGVGRPCLCNECGWDWGKHRLKCKVAKLLADLKHCLEYGRPS